MQVISIRVDDKLNDKINQLAALQKVSRSEMIRIILISGTRHLDIEKDYLEKIYNLSLQNWAFSKKLLANLVSEDGVVAAREEAKSLFNNNQ